jgi:hypothetical protein
MSAAPTFGVWRPGGTLEPILPRDIRRHPEHVGSGIANEIRPLELEHAQVDLLHQILHVAGVWNSALKELCQVRTLHLHDR